MLRFALIDLEKNEKPIDKVFSAIYNSSANVPADDLTISFLYDKDLIDNADMILAYSDEKLIFKGQIDEIINLFNSDKTITKIVARSLAAGLLDNEAEPVTYYNPTADFIFERHLKPFGIKKYYANHKPFYGSLKISKGMSHWQVLENFCYSRFGSFPRITGDGIAIMEDKDSDSIIFGFEDGCIPFCSFKENTKRYKLISEVKVKLNELGSYEAHITNQNPDCKGIKRLRYVNATADNSTLATADKIIENGNLQSYCIVLECLGCYMDLIGAKAEIVDESIGRIDNLVVKEMKYIMGSGGEFTTVTLGKG